MDPFLSPAPRVIPCLSPGMTGGGASFFDYIIFHATEKCKRELKYLIIFCAPAECRSAKKSGVWRVKSEELRYRLRRQDQDGLPL